MIEVGGCDVDVDGTLLSSWDFSTGQGILNINITTGDYDADGNADLATTWSHCDRGVGCKTYVRVRYGDGKGGFSAPTAIDYDLDYQLNWSDDVNSDGRSDIYGYSS